jgi:putative hemolysin
MWLWVGACAGADPQPEPAQVPNPAARKCLEDGYDLQPVRDAAGVPINHDCVDKRSGKRCEVWDYFRGNCGLRETPSRELATPATR